ncbi:hypothetical protein BHMPCIPO_00704 [Ensifer sesbaniae]|nr:hypothetical protein [Ensifer sesbaniae]
MSIWNQTLIVVGAVSSILTIISFFLPIKSASSKYVHAVYVALVAGVVSIATSQSLQISRLNDIARTADKLVEDREMHFTHRGYVQASLAFLEKNRDLYPDTYLRALSLCAQFSCDKPDGDAHIVDLAFTMSGLIRGLGTMSN